MTPARRPSMKRLSFVIPFLNEAANLPVLYQRLKTVVPRLGCEAEYLFVNDGSRDASESLVRGWARSDPAVVLVNLSRNFGHQTAVFAGLQHASGDAVVILDADLQDRPEAVEAFLARWEAGADVVYAVREKRKENIFKRFLFSAFYRLLFRLASIPIPLEAGLFCLMDRKVVDVIAAMPERNRFVPGMRAWAGFRQEGVPVERDPRTDGPPRVRFHRLVGLALDAVFSFSTIPLRLATAVGLFSAFIAAVATGVVFYFRFFTTQAIPGWTSTLLSIFFFGSVQLISIGIIGEYLGRIYEEVKQRPAYVVREVVRGAAGDAPPAGGDGRDTTGGANAPPQPDMNE